MHPVSVLLAEYGSYFLIPFIAAAAGWGTNWLAIKMTFYPLEYVGKYPFGWRGVVPSRIRKFATGLVDTTIGRVGGLPAIVEAIDLDAVETYFFGYLFRFRLWGRAGTGVVLRSPVVGFTFFWFYCWNPDQLDCDTTDLYSSRAYEGRTLCFSGSISQATE